MGPKKGKGGDQGPSKKNMKANAEKRLEESTFGMKNKNKSAKVQNFIEKATKSVKNSSLYAEGDKAKQAKKDARQAQQLQEEELRLLFNDAISSQFGKNKAQKAADANRLGVDTQKSEVQEILDGISSDEESDVEYDEYGAKRRTGVMYNQDSGAGGGSSSGADVHGEEVVTVEVFKEKTIEDVIEEQRAKLLAQGTPGTPVTEATFQAWRAAKLQKKQADAEAKLKAEQTKKKGGKGLSVLSGKELFNYNATLFTDDDAAITANEEKALNAETQVVSNEADEKSNLERQRIMEDQERLAEIYRLEDEERKRNLDAWRFLCNNNATAIKKSKVNPNAPGPKPFCFDFVGVTVNGYVFAVEEEEMLDDFEDKEDPVSDSEDEEEEGEEAGGNNNSNAATSSA